MKLEELEILDNALLALNDKLLLPNDMRCKSMDSYIPTVRVMGIDFRCEIRSNVTTATMATIVESVQQLSFAEKSPVLLIGKYISPKVMDELAEIGINSLDCAGNCNIRYTKNQSTIFFIRNKGEKNQYNKEKAYPMFQEAGIKVIFYLLQDKDNVDKPYREIQQVTGVSLGAIRNVFNTLIEKHFILVNGNHRFLKNQKELLNLWAENYNMVLKPKLKLGRMSFRTPEQRAKWDDVNLPKGMYWGGEGAAHIIDGYLIPGTFDIYTDISIGYLMKTGAVNMDEHGEICIYQKFWKWEDTSSTVPALLIYADLMSSGNSRCIEAANRILENELPDYK